MAVVKKGRKGRLTDVVLDKGVTVADVLLLAVESDFNALGKAYSSRNDSEGLLILTFCTTIEVDPQEAWAFLESKGYAVKTPKQEP